MVIVVMMTMLPPQNRVFWIQTPRSGATDFRFSSMLVYPPGWLRAILLRQPQCAHGALPESRAFSGGHLTQWWFSPAPKCGRGWSGNVYLWNPFWNGEPRVQKNSGAARTTRGAQRYVNACLEKEEGIRGLTYTGEREQIFVSKCQPLGSVLNTEWVFKN